MHLPIEGNDPTDIDRTSSKVGLAETMKAKYQLEKGKNGYVIESINDHVVRVTIQLLASKLMRKCRVDEVLALVIAVVA